MKRSSSNASGAHLYRLYFVHMSGCGTCAATGPAVKAWVKAHPAVKFVPVDLSSVEWTAKSWVPRIVPTLVLMTPSGKVHKREHGAKREDIEAWVGEVAPELVGRH